MLHWRIEWASWRRGPSLEGDHGGREGERPRHSAQREQQKLRAGQREAERGQSGWKHEGTQQGGRGCYGAAGPEGKAPATSPGDIPTWLRVLKIFTFRGLRKCHLLKETIPASCLD